MQIKRIHLEKIDSTQDYAKRERAAFAPECITCITAEEQTAGRGRLGRKWISPRGDNLYATFYFRLPPNARDAEHLAQLMAHSLAVALRREGLHPLFKWPNDLQLNNKKVAGVLCEISGNEVFLGIGINVNTVAALIDQPATSLRLETGHSWDREALLEKLQRQFLSDLSLFLEEGFVPFRPFFNAME